MAVIITSSMMRLAQRMKAHAETGFFDGRNDTTPYFARARRWHKSGALLIFTRDEGMHTSGWFKNPDYDRCYHLSISFWDLRNDVQRPFETKEAEAWARAFYGDWTRYVWTESDTTGGELMHYRVMCDRAWQPIIPRGEVYTRDFIEKGWLSWSDQQYEKQRKGD